jgi:hypothetical protein
MARIKRGGIEKSKDETQTEAPTAPLTTNEPPTAPFTTNEFEAPITNESPITNELPTSTAPVRNEAPTAPDTNSNVTLTEATAHAAAAEALVKINTEYPNEFDRVTSPDTNQAVKGLLNFSGNRIRFYYLKSVLYIFFYRRQCRYPFSYTA